MLSQFKVKTKTNPDN